ncbi:hypothetical protein [Lentibacter sp.]|uniref:hypothetical protein n=1 Tax=Lentibacter sp. TaxID=2024994 RepID=UPI003F6C8578
MSGLHNQLLAAHEHDDREGLIVLYTEAADRSNDLIERSFFLTHAFVFALEAGDMRARDLHARLHDMGRI